MIAILDYKMGNVQSVSNAFEGLGCEVKLTARPEDLERATHIVLPGVGAFGEGMKNLRELSLIDVLREQVIHKKKPFLGICLGMQLMADEGFEFGHHRGLGWIAGQVKRLESGDLAVPHIGWNNIAVTNPSPVLTRITNDTDFYFVHSYHFAAASPEDVQATCDYGQTFTAVVGRGNLCGVQFHPEKSQKTGRALLENFAGLR